MLYTTDPCESAEIAEYAAKCFQTDHKVGSDIFFTGNNLISS